MKYAQIFALGTLLAMLSLLVGGGCAASGAPVFTSWLESDGTNLFFISTVPPGFTNALTTNSP